MTFGFEMDLGEAGLEMFESITDADLEIAKDYADSLEDIDAVEELESEWVEVAEVDSVWELEMFNELYEDFTDTGDYLKITF